MNLIDSFKTFSQEWVQHLYFKHSREQTIEIKIVYFDIAFHKFVPYNRAFKVDFTIRAILSNALKHVCLCYTRKLIHKDYSEKKTGNATEILYYASNSIFKNQFA